jgi:hypothetical protein
LASTCWTCVSTVRSEMWAAAATWRLVRSRGRRPQQPDTGSDVPGRGQ